MYLNVAVDFSENFIEKVAEYEEVKVLFGKMPSDYIGGGIDTSLLKNISYDYFFAYIEKAKKMVFYLIILLMLQQIEIMSFLKKEREK